jgi:type IV secretion system protein VirD4
VVLYALVFGLLAPVVAMALLVTRRRVGGAVQPAASWASGRDLRPLRVRGATPGRLTLGRAGGQLLATEAGQSLLVLGPTQSGKTSGLAIPALLEWEGPVLATSVKGDLLRATIARRRELGKVDVFDPLGMAGDLARGAAWSPLAAAGTWAGARRVAAGLCSVARAGTGVLEDGAFWYATAEKLLAPLLFAAAASGGTMADVVRWVDTAERDEVFVLLDETGSPDAWRAAVASFSREERQLSSVYTTTETVLAAFADPVVVASTSHSEIEPGALLDGGSGSLFVVAPAHDQDRLATVFVTLVREVLERAFAQATIRGGPLRPGLLVVLDEAANVAPLGNLDTLASIAASHGIQLVTVFQDLAQIEARYGTRAQTVMNNHRAKLVLSGIADSATLEQLSGLIGDATTPARSVTRERWNRSTTESFERRRLAPADWLRRISPGEAVLIYGHLAPCRLSLRPWFAERSLTYLAKGTSRQARGAIGPRRSRSGATGAAGAAGGKALRATRPRGLRRGRRRRAWRGWPRRRRR